MNESFQTEHITLYYREGNSDKVYQAAIEAKGDGFVVNFAYGRRGSTMQTGTKTTSPLAYPAAKKIYDKIVAEKTAKGYSPGSDGTPYQNTELAQRATGILPQLLNPIDETEVQNYILDREYCAQEKFDGKRTLIRKVGKEVTGINRKGLSIALPETIVQAAQALAGDFVIDGECLGDRFQAFDILEQDGKDLRQHPYRTRNQALLNILREAPAAILYTETALTAPQKAGLLASLRKQRREGLVFKYLEAPYKAGRPASGGSQLKFKFLATLSAIVARVNTQRSVEIQLRNGKKLVSVGNVTIPANFQVPPVGAVVEVRYLYAYREGSLFQPVYLGERTDIDAQACTTNQLKYKADDEES